MRASCTISEVAESAGVTVRALRYYEAVGLLRPVRTPTRRRMFCTEQLAAARRVARLRRLGLSIAQIRSVTAPDVDGAVRSQRLAELLERRLELAQAHVERIRLALDEARLEGEA